MIQELDDWLSQDPRRTAVLGKALRDGKLVHQVILHDAARWNLPKDWPIDLLCQRHSPDSTVEKITYADSLEEAIRQAIRL